MESASYIKFCFFVQVELILEQMRLILAKKDYIRTQIISKKINTKFFEGENITDHIQDLKLKYYRYILALNNPPRFFNYCE